MTIQKDARGKLSLSQVGCQVGFGILVGYFISHPVSMLIFHLTDSSAEMSFSRVSVKNLLTTIIGSYHAEMLSMGLLFAVVGAVVTGIYGYHRSIIVKQNNQLLEQLAHMERLHSRLEENADLLKKQNQKLVSVEKTNRR